MLETRKLTAVAIAECRNTSTDNHDDAPNHDGRLPAQVVRHVRRNEVGNDGTNIEHVDKDAELVRVGVLGEILLPLIHLLRGVDHHAIVAGGGGGHEQEYAEDIELAQVRLAVPGYFGEAGGFGECEVEVFLDVGLDEVLGRGGGRADHDGLIGPDGRGLAVEGSDEFRRWSLMRVLNAEVQLGMQFYWY